MVPPRPTWKLKSLRISRWFEVRCKKEPHDVRILKAPEPLPRVSGGEAPSLEDRMQGAISLAKRCTLFQGDE